MHESGAERRFFINFEQIFIPLGVITWHGMWWALNTYSLCKFI